MKQSKSTELRQLLLAGNNLKAAADPQAHVKYVNKAESQAAAIAARRAELHIVPKVVKS